MRKLIVDERRMLRFPWGLLIPLFGALFLFGCASAQKGPSPETYYVRADGSDRNDGLSEEKPFRSLFKALSVISAPKNKTNIRTITVLGVLDLSSERSTGKERVFIIQGMGKEPLLIRGSASGEKAVLSGTGAGRRVVLVKGVSNIHFEHIAISGGEVSGEGGGIGIGPGSELTLGQGALVTGNRALAGGGIAVAPGGKLRITEGAVLDNAAGGVGGGVALAGVNASFVMEGGEIRRNGAEGGGGVAVYEGGSFIMRAGLVADNQAAVAGGGVVLNTSGEFIMEGGGLNANRSSGSGGGLALVGNCSFILREGEINGNACEEQGGGIAADGSAALELSGGIIAGNKAKVRGGGVFVMGNFFKPSESSCTIYGNDASSGNGNSAPNGGAVYVYRGIAGDLVREASAAGGVLLNSGISGPGGGWGTGTRMSGEGWAHDALQEEIPASLSP